MAQLFETITINESEIYRPNDFKLEREDVYAGEYVTCTGKTIADRIGWKYADTTLSWDAIPNSQMAVLTGLSGQGTITFADSDGNHTETFIRAGFENTPTRFTYDDGSVVWKDVNLNIRFINAHND